MNDVMTPEEYELLMSLGGENAQLAQEMAMQQAQAEQLRQEMPQGGMAGRVFVPPNILQYAGKLAGDRASGLKQQAAAATGKTMGANTNAQNRMMMEGILRGGQPPQPAAAVPEADPYARFRQAGGFA